MDVSFEVIIQFIGRYLSSFLFKSQYRNSVSKKVRNFQYFFVILTNACCSLLMNSILQMQWYNYYGWYKLTFIEFEIPTFKINSSLNITSSFQFWNHFGNFINPFILSFCIVWMRWENLCRVHRLSWWQLLLWHLCPVTWKINLVELWKQLGSVLKVYFLFLLNCFWCS